MGYGSGFVAGGGLMKKYDIRPSRSRMTVRPSGLSASMIDDARRLKEQREDELQSNEEQVTRIADNRALNERDSIRADDMAMKQQVLDQNQANADRTFQASQQQAADTQHLAQQSQWNTEANSEVTNQGLTQTAQRDQQKFEMENDYKAAAMSLVSGDPSGVVDYMNRYGNVHVNLEGITRNEDGSFTVIGEGQLSQVAGPDGVTVQRQPGKELGHFASAKDMYTQFFGKVNPSNLGGEAKTKSGSKASRPHVDKLLAEGWRPTGRMTGPTLDAIEAAAVYAEANGLPFTKEDAMNHDFSALKNQTTGRTAGGRLPLARKQNIESAFSLLDDMGVTGKNLNYSGAQFVGAIEKWGKGQLNDPLFTEYMTQRADALFVLGNALKQNGLTDKSIEIEEEAAHPTMNPAALTAYLNAQYRALNRAAEEMNGDFGYDIKTRETAPAGVGGVMPESQQQGQQPQRPPEGDFDEPMLTPDGTYCVRINGQLREVER